MKKFFISVLISLWVSLISFSCKTEEEEPIPNYDFIQLKLDGVGREYRRPVLTVYHQAIDQLDLVMADESGSSCGIYINGGNVLKRRVPQIYSLTVGTIFDGISLISLIDQVPMGIFASQNHTKNGLTVKVLAISDSTVQGEFYGTIIPNDGSESKKISKGRFKLKFTLD